jgi:aldose 1-epimerase
MDPPPGRVADALYAGLFPMVPFANCIRDNRFEFAGKTYEVKPNMAGVRLNYHGPGWQLPWQVASQGPAAAELGLSDVEVAPGYRFSARQEFQLDAAGLHVTITVTNRSADPMPFSFGQHPWFVRHDRALFRFLAAGYWSEDANGHAQALQELTPKRDFSNWREPPRDYQNVCFTGWSGEAEICWPGHGVGLRISADPVFRHLMFHVPDDNEHDNENVFCLEPQTSAPCGFDGLNEGKAAAGVHILAPDDSVSGSVLYAMRGA